ncbi:probable inactive histone-lysine N-methyltransferase SUVR2 isoform X1 [Gastrolobium bilobum]|uniref:probable inactive histone-lysine N-methyltransferase SUVR2 isoform X1 n=1 Tax=Gastrolobium bilobum TaxID=150636 RepID=UPI002AAF5417|nr:probable inactive histone-lysine N-methyltransferase SUVR2 isoform X1 [Gastrolobium bilobum]
MAPNPKVVAAYRAMANLGIHESKVKPVLKKLLRLYDKNWELIEEESYRALADAIFEEDENKVPELEQKKKSKRVDEAEVDDEEAHMHDEPLRPLKRLRLRGQEVQSSRPLTSFGPSSAASLLKIPKLDDDTVPGSSFSLEPRSTAALSDENASIEVRQVPPQDAIVDKGKKPLSPQVNTSGRKFISDRAPPAVPVKEPTVEPGASLLPKNKMPLTYSFIEPKDEPIDDIPDYEVPIAVVPSEPSGGRDGATGKQDGHGTVASQCREPPAVPCKEPTVEPGASYALIEPKDEPVDDMPNYGVPIAVIPSELSSGRDSSMKNGAAGKQDCHDTVASQCRDEEIGGEDILPFSNEEATSNVEIASSSMGEEGPVNKTLTVDVSKESEANSSLIVRGKKDSVMPSCISNGSINVKTSSLVAPEVPISLPCRSGLDDAVLVSMKDGMNDFIESDGGKEREDPISPNSYPKHHVTTKDIMTICDVNDLTKGEERVKISWVNNITNDSLPSFHYIPRNLVFEDAYVNISLSRIGNEDCCSTCMGNCVLSSKPCSCANKTGGEFAYTAQGLLKEEFLEECIAISRNPQNYFCCKYCPLERAKNTDCLEPCKGHLKRKFIKECWSKCGCGKLCGNRVVQRGITCNLQVFLTSDGKGWGLRTLEDIPKGAFVCEFVGEILTVKELHERNLKYPENGKYRYPIILDANWDSEVLKDKEALCLYAASYGNAARFINHRCLDANLIEIPVEIEGPSHHYYHFAFFTARKIEAQEELTWDYGINFDDHDHPVQLFRCRCGSKFCRNMKRSNRSIRSSIAR